MSFAKGHLKAARDCITKKDYLTAKKEASLVLDFEPENYNAQVFLALALSELGEPDASEQAYRKATELNPTHPLAWQGLANFYERQEEWNKQADTLIQLINLFNKTQDAVKCAETLQKLVALYRKHGSQSQLISSLSYYLPESTVYSLISTLPEPDPTNPAGTTTYEAQDAIHNGLRILEEIVSLTELYEEDTIKREVEKRRTRLGASSPEQLRKEVFSEVFSKSRLQFYYDSILNHPHTSDELRAVTESKQLRYKQRYLYSIPLAKGSLKAQISKELDELIEGIILLRKEDELAWNFYFEGKDCETASGYDHKDVQAFIKLFPDSSIASLFKGYFNYKGEELLNGEGESAFSPGDEDPLDAVLNISLNLSDTIIANRFLGDVYLDEGDYENAIKTSKKGLQKLSQFESDTGKTLSKTRTGFQVILATSLVHFFSPKHHPEATRIVDEILARSAQNTTALMDRAFILQAASEWEKAAAVFDQVSSLVSEDTESGLRAREESGWCICQLGHSEAGLQALHQVLKIWDSFEGEDIRSHRARCLWRIGKCTMDIGGTNIQSAYQYFINSLKQDPDFAPAFTSLGIYYLEHASPTDPIRSSKCFQKAFELDARESLAARRLAEGFANDREWDLVEVVAQRTIDGEGGLNAGLAKSELDASSRYLPTNSWAWKAIGIAKLHYKDYPAAIQAIQIALRVEPDDQPLWVRLGEAYSKSGRHAAALKALNHGHEMNPDDWICSYFIADVKQTMGLFEEAIVILNAIRLSRPDEGGVLSMLAQAYLDLGRSEVSDGFQIRAEETFVHGIKVALDMIQRVPGFRIMAWKIIADAAFQLSCFSVYNDEGNVLGALQAIPFLPSQEAGEDLEKIVAVPTFRDRPLNRVHVVSAAIHACLSRLSLYSLNETKNSGAWYDLSVALQSWVTIAPPSADIPSATEKVIEYLKKALQLDALNDTYWDALGNAYILSHPRAAQHAYIKALEIDSKNARTWVNLGLMYFYHGDVELANEALNRAQVLDPDNTLAWVGQFLISRANGDTANAMLLLEHAVGLPTPVSEADYEFACGVFNSKETLRRTQAQAALLPAFFLLNRYCQRRPQDPSGLHLLSLVCERLGHFVLGEELVGRAVAILETTYEETEDPEVERKYGIANATLGRLKLAQGAYSESVAFFESTLGLLTTDAEEDGKEAVQEEDGRTKALKVQAYLGLGLAHFFQGNLREALETLENGISAAEDDLGVRGQVTIVLAQTLWAIGTEEARETAKTRLLECIASDPDNLTAINTLAGMGILTNDDGLVDAALSEILSLPVDQKHKLDPQRHVDYLLIRHCLAQEDKKRAISIAQHAVNMEPSNMQPRNRLASLIVQSGQHKDALGLLTIGRTSELDVEAATALSIQAVAQASEKGTEGLRSAQRAIMMRPSDMRGWGTLAYVRARMTSDKL